MSARLTCRELIDFIVDFFDGRLPPAQNAHFESHLEVCPDCVNYLDSYRQTVRIVKEALAQEEDAVTAGVPEELVTAVLRARVSGS